MSSATCQEALEFANNSDIKTIELTGGAPELNPNFKDVIINARQSGKKVVVRSNLTVLAEDGMQGLPWFYAEQGVELVCSMPCYLEQNVDAQRGVGAYHKSIGALKMLNTLGFGISGSGRSLHLVYNPGGPFLPGDQKSLEADYQEKLREAHGIEFSSLFTITNMPIGRFASHLESTGRLDDYKMMLRTSANSRLLDNVMCRGLISVSWEGIVYDCDFNQALGLPLGGRPQGLSELKVQDFLDTPIVLGEHCYGCIAGKGSSCTGSLREAEAC